LTQVEDAMFIDQYNVVTLEYHYYQNNCKYTHLEQCDEHIDESGKLVDEDGEEVTHLLGSELYQQDHTKIHPMSAFSREGILNYADSH
jgi:hypothetical protein